MALQIASECACVGDVVQLLNVDMSALAGALKDAQMSQLGTVVSNITETVDATVSKTEWWLGQAADALIWGAASVPFGEEVFGINVAISITASMFGSILSSGSGGSGNIPPPPTVMLAECGSQLESFYENTINSNLNELTAVLQDPVKLPLIYGLVQRAWAWPTNFVAGTFSAQAENTYRTSFYQQLIPMAFQVMVWSNVSRSQPFCVETVGKYPAYENVNAPANAYLSLGAGGGLNNIYMLYQGSGNLSHRSDFKYPGSSLTNDLFQTLGVSPADFFTGSDGWNIPTVTADVDV